MNDESTGTKALEPGIGLARLALLVGLGYLLFATFQPFFSALIWSAVLSYGLHPLYRKLVRVSGNRTTLSAVVMSLAVTVGFILPLAYISFLIGKELATTYLTVVASLLEGPGLLEQWRGHPWVSVLVGQLQEFERLTGTDLRSVLVGNLADLGSALVEKLTHVAGNVLAGLTELSIILLCMFYFFRDGEGVVEWVKELLPLAEERQRLVVRRFDDVVKGAVLGNTLVAALEGIVGGITFWMVGLPAALLWGTAMFVLAYLPLVGAGIVWGPVAVYLFFQGRYWPAIVLCIAGFLIAVLDYVVRTIVVGGASKLHTLLTFFGVLGGIQFFGLVGIVAGPLVV
ncbi:MAG TPA: AI-2E family transporter, partial [Nitrospira sp.]|nr:AI-2E family transporter [Nitrospira sp.]